MYPEEVKKPLDLDIPMQELPPRTTNWREYSLESILGRNAIVFGLAVSFLLICMITMIAIGILSGLVAIVLKIALSENPSMDATAIAATFSVGFVFSWAVVSATAAVYVVVECRSRRQRFFWDFPPFH